MNELTVVKIGGAVVEQELLALWRGVATYRNRGSVVVVHGGGPQSTELARRLGHEPRMIQGRRITTDVDLEIVKMTLAGTVNTNLVASALAANLPAVGLSGISGRLVQVVRRPAWIIDDEPVDFGHVGDIVRIDTAVLHAQFRAEMLPIVACMGIDDEGRVYNVNADTVAAEVASSLGAIRLILVTESGGIRDPSGNTVSSMSADQALGAVAQGWIEGGMKVKVETAISALNRGVKQVRISNPAGVAEPNSGTTITEEIHV